MMKFIILFWILTGSLDVFTSTGGWEFNLVLRELSKRVGFLPSAGLTVGVEVAIFWGLAVAFPGSRALSAIVLLSGLLHLDAACSNVLGVRESSITLLPHLILYAFFALLSAFLTLQIGALGIILVLLLFFSLYFWRYSRWNRGGISKNMTTTFDSPGKSENLPSTPGGSRVQGREDFSRLKKLNDNLHAETHGKSWEESLDKATSDFDRAFSQIYPRIAKNLSDGLKTEGHRILTYAQELGLVKNRNWEPYIAAALLIVSRREHNQNGSMPVSLREIQHAVYGDKGHRERIMKAKDRYLEKRGESDPPRPPARGFVPRICGDVKVEVEGEVKVKAKEYAEKGAKLLPSSRSQPGIAAASVKTAWDEQFQDLPKPRAKRERKKLSMRNLAEAVKVSPNTVATTRQDLIKKDPDTFQVQTKGVQTPQ